MRKVFGVVILSACFTGCSSGAQLAKSDLSFCREADQIYGSVQNFFTYGTGSSGAANMRVDLMVARPQDVKSTELQELVREAARAQVATLATGGKASNEIWFADMSNSMEAIVAFCEDAGFESSYSSP